MCVCVCASCDTCAVADPPPPPNPPAADVAECGRLLDLCTRDAVRATLKLKLSELTNRRDGALAALKAAADAAAASSVAAPVAASGASAGAGAGTGGPSPFSRPAGTFTTIPAFAWDEVGVGGGGW